MKLQILSVLSIGLLFNSCAQAPQKEVRKREVVQIQTQFELQDFLKENKDLDAAVDKVFASLDDTAIVAQLIMPAVGRLGQEKATIDQHIKDRIIGGVLMLNGTKEGFTSWIADFEKQNKANGNLPFLYSADAEPSLVNRKIAGSTLVKKANEMQSIEEVRTCAQTISKDLNAIGINYNFSPVVDMSPNATVGFRSFGAVPLKKHKRKASLPPPSTSLATAWFLATPTKRCKSSTANSKKFRTIRHSLHKACYLLWWRTLPCKTIQNTTPMASLLLALKQL
jgi:beta-N-acetylhexosaminidase